MIEISTKIKELIESDDYNRETIDRSLINLYKKSDLQQRKVINDFMICLCGYSFEKLIGDYNGYNETRN